MEYARLREDMDSSTPPRRFILYCIPWGYTNETDQEKLNKTMTHLKGSIQEMHVKILSQNQHIKTHREKGIDYLNKNEEALAESEARLLMHALEIKQVYIDVKEKMIVLHKELGKVTTLAACAQVLQQSSDVLGRTIEAHLNIVSIDQTMERLESQLHKTNHAQRAMAEPLKRERVREVLELQLPNIGDTAHSRVAVVSRVQVKEKEEEEGV